MHITDEIIDDLDFERSAKTVCPEADVNDVIFFDIETTGLSPMRSGLYLIGCMFVDGKNTVLRQFFADDLEDEKSALISFAELLDNKEYVVHFNGSTFDIPYLKNKYRQHSMKDPFEDKKSCDIYRMLLPLKKMLSLKSMKQKSLEELSGIHRDDMFTGGELIDVYKNYQKLILLSRARKEEEETAEITQMRKILLLHNSDDIKGMMPVAGLIGIVSFAEGGFDVGEPYSEEGIVKTEIIPDCEIPACAFEGKSPLRFISRDDSGKMFVNVPLIRASLRLFMKEFRDHYYIPSKDMAVHASVAGFIASGEKKRATPATCYVPCEGSFLTVREEDLPEGLPLIKHEYSERIAYVRIEDLSPEVLKAAVMYRLMSRMRGEEDGLQ
ncbi:MAG: ribonuclease H-like domain-containing protein [Lachnospiraceae bacterium]|nr:ribonuclease H-like domain-containing protein [Lachnospiraceae bacterium]